MQIGVIGLGNWGTALGQHLASKGYSVTGWARESEIVSGINSARRNPRALSAVELHPRFAADGELERAAGQPLVVLAVPSEALAEIASRLKFEPQQLLVSVIKGFERGSLLTPLQFLARRLAPNPRLAVLSGPSFAIDIARGLPAGVVAAAHEKETAEAAAKAFISPTLKVYTSTDPLGVELGGALKNAIALAAGVCDALSLGDSARAGIITRGLAEMKRLADAMGADARTLSGLSGLGDLVMTATCDASRNRRFGLLLGKGLSAAEAQREIGSTVEGTATAALALQLGRKHGVELPIIEKVVDLLEGKLSVRELPAAMMSRPMREEFEWISKTNC